MKKNDRHLFEWPFTAPARIFIKRQPRKRRKKTLFSLFAPVLLAWLGLLSAGRATAQITITVTSTADSGPGTLRDALAGAANGDTIDATGVTGAILLTSGELLVPNSVTILGPGPANLAVDGNAASRVFNISGAAVTIAGLTITNGFASGGFQRNFGGGIYTGPGTLTVSNCTLSGNSASYGGGVYNEGYRGSATLQVVTSALSGNSATKNGGGIYNHGEAGTGTVQVLNSTLSGNSAQYGGGIYNDGVAGSATLLLSASTLSSNSATGNGGGIYNDGNSGSAALTLSASILRDNSAPSGGGIFNAGIWYGTGTVQVVTSTLSSNSATGTGGGGIFNDGTLGSAALTLSASTFTGNSASFNGGGIYNNGNSGKGTLTVSNSTLSGNSASAHGGGIYNNGQSSGTGAVQIANSTLSGNSVSGDGGAIYNLGQSSGKATLLVRASTFSGNSAGGGNGSGIRNYATGGSASVEIGSTILKAGAVGAIIASLSGTVISDGYNLASDDGAGFLTGTADQINTEPMLGPLQDNGGPTFTHALLPGSPAIDQGKNLNGPATDQRGFPRTLDRPCIANALGGDGTDIGAFESQQPCPVALPLVNVGVVLNQFGFDLAGSSNQVVIVEASTNLVSWTALATNTLGAAPLLFNDLGWTNFRQRFYRVKLAP